MELLFCRVHSDHPFIRHEKGWFFVPLRCSCFVLQSTQTPMLVARACDSCNECKYVIRLFALILMLFSRRQTQVEFSWSVKIGFFGRGRKPQSIPFVHCSYVSYVIRESNCFWRKFNVKLSCCSKRIFCELHHLQRNAMEVMSVIHPKENNPKHKHKVNQTSITSEQKPLHSLH